jgi:hypothetical protein
VGSAADCRADLAAASRAGLAGYRVGFPEAFRAGCPAGSPEAFRAGSPADYRVADYREEFRVRAPAWRAIPAACRDKRRAGSLVKCPDRLPAGFRGRPRATRADAPASRSLDRPPASVAARATLFPALKDRSRQGRRPAARVR